MVELLDTGAKEGGVEVEEGTCSRGSASLNTVESWVVDVVENVARIDCGKWSCGDDDADVVLHLFFNGFEILRVSRLEKYSSLSPSSSSEIEEDESDPDSMPSLSCCSFLSFSITHRYCPVEYSVEEALVDEESSLQ